MQQLSRNPKARVILGLVLLCVLALLPSFRAVFEGKWPFDEDAIALFGPWRVWTREVLSGGILPLWNPYLFMGIPFMSNGQTAVLYPFNIIYWIFPVYPAMLLDAILHSLMLGAGGYLLAQALGRSRGAAWLCAICLMLAGGVSAHLYAGHMTWHAARAYLPLIVWALICFLRFARPKYLWAMAVFFALQVFAGYPPYVLWSVCWCAVFCLAWWWANREEMWVLRDAVPPRKLLLPGLLLLLIASAAVLPLRETSALSAHGAGLSFEHATSGSSTLAGWVRLALPNFYGGNRVAQWSIANFAHEEAAYIGLLPLGLALFAPLLWRWNLRETGDATDMKARRFVNALWLMLPIALLLALGKYTPVYRILFDALPPLRIFRVPARWFEIWYFAACVLAAFGWDAYFKVPLSHAKRAFAALGVFVLLMLMVGGAVATSSPKSPFWMETAQWNKKQLHSDYEERVGYAIYLQRIAFESVVISIGVALGLLLLLNRLHNTEGARSLFWKKLVLALVAFDLLLLFWSSARFAHDSHPENPWPHEIGKFYRSSDRWSTAFEGESAADGLNLGLPHEIGILGGYDALASKDYFTLANTIEGREFWSAGYQPQRFDPLLRVAGVTHFFASPDSPMPARLIPKGAKLSVRFGHGANQMQLWELPGAWPREYLTTRVLRASREDQLPLLRELATQNGAGGRTPVVVDGMAYTDLPSPDVSMGRVVKSQRLTNRSIIEIETASPQILVQSETLYPGWRAWINGKPAQIERANFLFRSVQVPSGKSRVVFVYDSQTYRFGVFLSLSGLALFAGAISFAASNRRRRQPAAATSNSPS